MSGSIVVGVDGSDASHEALRWAAEEARLRSAALVAVHAWSFVAAAADRRSRDARDARRATSPVSSTPRARLRRRRSTLRSRTCSARTTAVDVERKLVEGDAGEVLVAESGDADLVVVGSHGRSGLKAALLGSVSRHVVDHAACPVVVVKQRS